MEKRKITRDLGSAWMDLEIYMGEARVKIGNQTICCIVREDIDKFVQELNDVVIKYQI